MNKKDLKILIVDDDELVVEGIKKNLEHSGYVVNIALGGKEALELFTKEYFDIVLVDLVMPDMNGVEVCKKIKELSSKTVVLLLSGYPNEVEKFLPDFVMAGGTDLFLRKPLLTGDIEKAIEKVVADMQEKTTV